jgi:hypothetical protein
LDMEHLPPSPPSSVAATRIRVTALFGAMLDEGEGAVFSSHEISPNFDFLQ